MTTKPVLTLDGVYDGYQFLAGGSGVIVNVKVPGRQWADRISWLNPSDDLRARLPSLHGNVRVTYTESDKTTQSGNPYKDGVDVVALEGSVVPLGGSVVPAVGGAPAPLRQVAQSSNTPSIEANSSMQAATSLLRKAMELGKVDPADFDTINTVMLSYTEIAMRSLQSVKGIKYEEEPEEIG